MSEISNLYSGNPDALKSWLEANRQNGFMDLPQQHRAFVLEYIKTHDRFDACDVAGISRNQSLKVLRDPLVQEFIKYLNEQKQHYSLIDASFIEVQYLSLYGKLLGEEEVAMVDKDGNTLVRKKFHASESVAALRDMAKMSGVYKEDPVSPVNVNVNLADVKLTNNQQAALDKALDDEF